MAEIDIPSSGGEVARVERQGDDLAGELSWASACWAVIESGMRRVRS